MPSPPTASPAATGRPRSRLPATAERLRLPLYDRSQARLLERWGFDLNAADAVQRAEIVLAESPADPDRLLLAAAVRSSRGDEGGALAAARSAVAVADGSARAHTTLATLLSRHGDIAAAHRHAVRAVELDPEDPIALYNRGVTAWAGGDHAWARADFHRVGELLGMAALPWWSRWLRRR
jgi:tetratricopeptide (TPR) repeat protein